MTIFDTTDKEWNELLPCYMRLINRIVPTAINCIDVINASSPKTTGKCYLCKETITWERVGKHSNTIREHAMQHLKEQGLLPFI